LQTGVLQTGVLQIGGLPIGVLQTGVLQTGVLQIGVLPIGGLPIGGLPIGGLQIGGLQIGVLMGAGRGIGGRGGGVLKVLVPLACATSVWMAHAAVSSVPTVQTTNIFLRNMVISLSGRNTWRRPSAGPCGVRCERSQPLLVRAGRA
jgi:hypothetical protein